MTSHLRLIALASAVMIPAASAIASDLDPPPPIDDLRPATYDWSGFYAGVNAGYALGKEDVVGLLPGFGNIGTLQTSGYFGGVQAGFNYQAHHLVLGVEGDGQWAGISDDDTAAPFTMSSELNYFGTLRGRVGFALENLLVYGTAGLALGDVDYSIVGAGGSLSENYLARGFALGAGAEYAFDEDWSMKAEYMYLSFGNKTLSSGGQTTSASPSVHTARVGLNYRF